MLVSACSEGYSSKDEALILHYGMGRDETIRAMNQIGREQQLDYRWHYELRPDCTLVVHAKRLFGGRKPIAVSLLDKEALVFKSDAAGKFDVALRTRGNSEASDIRILIGAHNVEAGQMKWLMDYAPGHCAPASGPGS